jgi:hypothetical protein
VTGNVAEFGQFSSFFFGVTRTVFEGHQMQPVDFYGSEIFAGL